MATAQLKHPTRANLQKQVDELQASVARHMQTHDTLRREIEVAATDAANTRAQFSDLKQRLASAEFENQRMRGYIARVHEDDTVREPLVSIGDPDGARQLVPKRKPTLFQEPIHSSPLGPAMVADGSYNRFSGERQREWKHWVTY